MKVVQTKTQFDRAGNVPRLWVGGIAACFIRFPVWRFRLPTNIEINPA